ncbi:hypothetical protein CkaCkLH20_01530 [Colletotrichum karsti]|uniref:Uncharacterized protein n=1 Tax=Colletotrichum karsti TaxID=1095194 RepID=A0A9P6IJC2_9PEZI|nr:uncharacterized protein CkaCkLH20_01530 [Colletotrichum karsti]KAF9881380.1 hypothetical protein CkaCkLH20_01530 [Colletotrichum karsti]
MNLQQTRKRSASAMSMSDSQDSHKPHLPKDSINPLSHTPSVLTQLRLAGLADADQPPSFEQSKFPHRAWRDANASTRRGPATAVKPLESDSDEQDDQQDDGSGLRRRSRKKDGEKKTKYASEKSHFRPLVRAIYGFLDNGDVPNAKRAFGILTRSHVYGKPVDLRRNNYWALGAEILMREGGGVAAHSQEAEAEAYPAENIPRVREYFQDLIQRYPYNFKWRKAISAVDFWPALLSYEVYQLHVRQTASLRRLEHEAEDWEDDSFQENSVGSGHDGLTMDDSELVAEGPAWHSHARDRRLRQAKDQIRLRALDGLREVAGRMDDLLEDRPYSTNPELLRLRGMVSLYIGDLLIPAYTEKEGQVEEATARRGAENNNARNSFQRMMEHGGRPDTLIQQILAPAGEGHLPILPLFSSLPIREYGTAS